MDTIIQNQDETKYIYCDICLEDITDENIYYGHIANKLDIGFIVYICAYCLGILD